MLTSQSFLSRAKSLLSKFKNHMASHKGEEFESSYEHDPSSIFNWDWSWRYKMCCDIHPDSWFQSGCSSPTPCSSCPLARRESLFLFSTISPNQTHVFFILSHARARFYSAARWSRIEIKTLWEQVDSFNRASVKNIRTETNYRDGCRNPFCIFCFNPAWKYYLDQAHIMVYFSPMIQILLPFWTWDISLTPYVVLGYSLSLS